jgi:hypothetical protein
MTASGELIVRLRPGHSRFRPRAGLLFFVPSGNGCKTAPVLSNGRPAVAAAVALGALPVLSFVLLFVADADASFLILLPFVAAAIARWWGDCSRRSTVLLSVGSVAMTAVLIGVWAVVGLLIAGDSS